MTEINTEGHTQKALDDMEALAVGATELNRLARKATLSGNKKKGEWLKGLAERLAEMFQDIHNREAYNGHATKGLSEYSGSGTVTIGGQDD